MLFRTGTICDRVNERWPLPDCGFNVATAWIADENGKNSTGFERTRPAIRTRCAAGSGWEGDGRNPVARRAAQHFASSAHLSTLAGDLRRDFFPVMISHKAVRWNNPTTFYTAKSDDRITLAYFPTLRSSISKRASRWITERDFFGARFKIGKCLKYITSM